MWLRRSWRRCGCIPGPTRTRATPSRRESVSGEYSPWGDQLRLSLSRSHTQCWCLPEPSDVLFGKAKDPHLHWCSPAAHKTEALGRRLGNINQESGDMGSTIIHSQDQRSIVSEVGDLDL